MFKHTLLRSRVLTNIIFVVVGCVFAMSISSVSAQYDDPMRPPGYRLIKPGKNPIAFERRYALSFVQISSLRRSAIINDRLVGVGSRVDGAKVIAIEPSSVKLKKNGKVFTVKLLSKNIKKSVTR